MKWQSDWVPGGCGHRNKWNISDNGKLWWQEFQVKHFAVAFPPSSPVATLDTNYRPLPPLHVNVKLICYSSTTSQRHKGSCGGGWGWSLRHGRCHFVQTQHHQCKLKIYYSGRKFPSHRYIDGWIVVDRQSGDVAIPKGHSSLLLLNAKNKEETTLLPSGATHNGAGRAGE